MKYEKKKTKNYMKKEISPNKKKFQKRDTVENYSRSEKFKNCIDVDNSCCLFCGNE